MEEYAVPASWLDDWIHDPLFLEQDVDYEYIDRVLGGSDGIKRELFMEGGNSGGA